MITDQSSSSVHWRQRLIGEIPRGHRLVFVGPIHYLDGKPLFCAVRERGSRRWIVVWGEEVLGRYDAVERLTVGEGRPLYIARDGWRHFVIWGDRVGKSYIGIGGYYLSTSSGKPFYLARRGPKTSLVWGEVEGDLYDGVGDVAFFDGKPAICTSRGPKFRGLHRVVWGSYRGREYGGVRQPVLVDGKILYVAEREHSHEEFLVWGDEEIPPYYDRIEHLAWVDGRPLFVAEFGGVGGSKQSFVVHGDRRGKTYRGGFSPISHFSLVDGVPLYAAEDDGRKVVVLGEIEVPIRSETEHYSVQNGMAILADQPLFVVERGHSPRQQVLFHGTAELGVYGSISCLQTHRGLPLFIAHSGKQASVVWGTAGSGLYDNVDFRSLRSEGDRIAFIAQQGREIYRVTGRVARTTDTARRP